MLQAQHEKGTQIIHLDNDKEYFNHVFFNFTRKHRITNEFTHVDTSQQNNVAERNNYHLFEVIDLFYFKCLFLPPIGERPLLLLPI